MTSRIGKAIAKGNLRGVKILVQEELLKQDNAIWNSDRQAEYDVLYKTVEVIHEAILDADGVEITPAYSEFVYVDGCPSLSEWLGETFIVQLEEQATYDADGLELTPYIPEITEQVRPYVANDVSVALGDFMLPHESKVVKDDINVQIATMLITVDSGKEFDATPEARLNMMSGILSAQFAGLTEVNWKLSDNMEPREQIVTLTELSQAVYYALAKFGQLKGIS